jgi:exopolysaccharide production protein ExoZ
VGYLGGGKLRTLFRSVLEIAPAGQKRYLAMEGLRGIAILMVFVCHYDVLVRENLNLPVSIVSFGSIIGRMGTGGVDLFFLLSGLLIYRSALRTDLNYKQFIKRRAVRIYPTFLTVFAVYLLLSVTLPSLTKFSAQGWQLVRAVLVNLAFLPGFLNVKPIVSVAWSLSYEWYFYITAPIVVRCLRLRDWKRSKRVSLLAASAVIYIILSALGPQISAVVGVPIYRFHVRLVMFLAGMLVFEILESGWLTARAHLWEWVAIGFAASGLVVLCMIEIAHGPGSLASIYTPRFEAIRCVVLIAIFMPITLFALGQNNMVNALLVKPGLRWLGNISYSYYLVHTLAIDAVKVLVVRSSFLQKTPLLSWVFLFPLSLTLSIVFGLALFLLIERPFSLRPNGETSGTRSGEFDAIGRGETKPSLRTA